MRSDLPPTGSSSGRWVTLGPTQESSQLSYGQLIKGGSGPQKISAESPSNGGKEFVPDTRALQRLRSTKPSKRLARLRDRSYRAAYARNQATTRVATQLRLLREKAGLSQAELAKKIGSKQGSISRIESMRYGKFSIATLQRIAEYFDVVAWVEFAPFSAVLRRTANLSPGALTPPSYDEEFDRDGEPSIDLNLYPDGSVISLINYISSGSRYLGTDWQAVSDGPSRTKA